MAFKLVFAALMAAAFVGCGDDDEQNQDPGQAAVAACTSLCDKQAAAQCGIPVDLCKQTCTATNSVPRCASLFKAWYDCQHALADVCDGAGCPTQSAAAFQCVVPLDGGTG
jgi:hypothetical protein